jgi:hypothetical protein
MIRNLLLSVKKSFCRDNFFVFIVLQISLNLHNKLLCNDGPDKKKFH